MHDNGNSKTVPFLVGKCRLVFGALKKNRQMLGQGILNRDALHKSSALVNEQLSNLNVQKETSGGDTPAHGDEHTVYRGINKREGTTFCQVE